MLVFVYGSLKRGFYNNYWLRDATFIREAKIRLPYQMIDMGDYPALVPSKRKNLIQGEIFKVTSPILKDLDRLEGVPNFYKRRITKFRGDEVWVYFLPDPEKYGDNLTPVPSGIWKKR